MAYVFSGTAIALGYGRGWLDAPAAYSIFRIDAALGRPLDINEAGRTYAQQAEFRWKYENVPGSAFALSPDAPSIHQKGNAVDTDDRFIALMNEHGWFQTALGVGETWHFEYDYNRDNHRNEPAGGGAIAFPLEDDMPTMSEFLNYPAYDDGPTISEFFKNTNARLDSLWQAVFTGGDSMPDNGRSIGQSLDGIVDVVDRIDARIAALPTTGGGTSTGGTGLSSAQVSEIVREELSKLILVASDAPKA